MAEYGTQRKLAAILSTDVKGCSQLLTDDRQMVFRTGIRLGDIIHFDDRICAGGVIIATREASGSSFAHSMMKLVYRLAGQEEKERTKVVEDRISNFNIENLMPGSCVDGY